MATLAPPERGPGPASPIAVFLSRLAVAFGRRRAYPEAHPLVRSAEVQAFESLSAVVAEQSRLSLSVGSAELLVDDGPAPAIGGVAHDLAERLRHRGVASLTFESTVTADALSKAIAWLAVEPAASSDAAIDSRYVPDLRGVVIRRIEYGRLALGDEHSAESSASAEIWRALAAVVDDEDLTSDGDVHRDRSVRHSREGGRGSGGTADALSEPSSASASDDESDSSTGLFDDAELTEVAGAIERRMARDGYARRVAFVLLRVADQVAQAPASHRAALGERLRTVLGSLQSSSVGAIIKSVGVGADQRRFMSQVIDALPVGAVIEWLESAARSTDQNMSHQLLRLLAKLSTRAQDAHAAPGAERSFRDAAHELVQGWTLDNPNPSTHTSLLDSISRAAPMRIAGASLETDAPRLVQIALEIDVFGEDAVDAAQELIAGGHVSQLLTWAAETPNTAAAKALRALVWSPAAIRATLLRDPLDQAEARALLSSLDHSSSETLLDVLRDAESRSTRRLVYDRVREFGPSISTQLIQRLDGAPWYFIRNLLALLRDTSPTHGAAADVAGATLLRFLSHQQEQVRSEALRLLAVDPSTRDRAIRQALDDRSERVVRVAIEMLMSDDEAAPRHAMSLTLAQHLLQFVAAGTQDDELLGRAVRALADAPVTAAVRDPLLALASRRTMLFRRLVLLDAKPVVVAALEVLAERYASDPKVTPLLTLAASHQDSRIRGAVTRSASRRTPKRAHAA